MGSEAFVFFRLRGICIFQSLGYFIFSSFLYFSDPQSSCIFQALRYLHLLGSEVFAFCRTRGICICRGPRYLYSLGPAACIFFGLMFFIFLYFFGIRGICILWDPRYLHLSGSEVFVFFGTRGVYIFWSNVFHFFYISSGSKVFALFGTHSICICRGPRYLYSSGPVACIFFGLMFFIFCLFFLYFFGLQGICIIWDPRYLHLSGSEVFIFFGTRSVYIFWSNV